MADEAPAVAGDPFDAMWDAATASEPDVSGTTAPAEAPQAEPAPAVAPEPASQARDEQGRFVKTETDKEQGRLLSPQAPQVQKFSFKKSRASEASKQSFQNASQNHAPSNLAQPHGACHAPPSTHEQTASLCQPTARAQQSLHSLLSLDITSSEKNERLKTPHPSPLLWK